MPRYGKGFKVTAADRQALAELTWLHKVKVNAMDSRIDTLSNYLHRDYLTVDQLRILNGIIENMHNPAIAKTEAVLTSGFADKVTKALKGK